MPRGVRRTSSIDDAFNQLRDAVTKAIADAKYEGHQEAIADIRNLIGDKNTYSGLQEVVRRGPGRPKGSKNAPKAPLEPKKKRKSSWAGLTPEQRLARVNAIRKGKGLPPRSA